MSGRLKVTYSTRVNEMNAEEIAIPKLPGLNCGSCGFKTCEEFAEFLKEDPSALKNCIHLNKENPGNLLRTGTNPCQGCTGSKGGCLPETVWKDSLGREFDFVLETFPEDPGPRETIKLHNPALTKELDIKVGDLIIGRPLGMSCGCPITHCGVVMKVDQKTGVMVWCVTGPLGPRQRDYIDIGYYSAEAYDGVVLRSQKELKIGMRCYFLPHRCMLQWRHSGLVNFLGKRGDQMTVRVEGLWIG